MCREGLNAAPPANRRPEYLPRRQAVRRRTALLVSSSAIRLAPADDQGKLVTSKIDDREKGPKRFHCLNVLGNREELNRIVDTVNRLKLVIARKNRMRWPARPHYQPLRAQLEFEK